MEGRFPAKGIQGELSEYEFIVEINIHVLIAFFDLLNGSDGRLLLDLTLGPVHKDFLLGYRVLENQVSHVMHI